MYFLAATAGSKSYILRSNLRSELIELANVTMPELIEDEIFESDDEEDEGAPPRTYASIFSWSTADQLGAIGITYVILALILLNGRALSDSAPIFSLSCFTC